MLLGLIFLALSFGEMRECEEVLSAQTFRVSELGAGIYLVKFKTSREMNHSLLRFSEHQENIFFRGKIFSLQEYKAWYRKQPFGGGKFSYYSDWVGHNLKMSSFDPFIQGSFKNLTLREKRLIQFIRKLPANAYLIVNAEDSEGGVIEHELAHALFAVDPVYRRAATKILESINVYPAYKWLKENIYHPSVFVDETQAYLMESSVDPKGSEEVFGRQNISVAASKLKRLFQRRIRELGIRVKT